MENVWKYEGFLVKAERKGVASQIAAVVAMIDQEVDFDFSQLSWYGENEGNILNRGLAQTVTSWSYTDWAEYLIEKTDVMRDMPLYLEIATKCFCKHYQGHMV